MRVLISGCGYVGGALGEWLARDGHEVFGLRRDPRKLPGGIVPVAADLTDAGSLEAALPAGLDYVFHTASPGVSGGDSAEKREAAYGRAYVAGPSNIIRALRSRGERPRRLVLTSSTGVYGQTGGEWVDETSPAEPTGPGRRILEGEETWLGGPFDAVVVRLAGIYGPGRTGALDRARRYPLADGAEREPPAYTNRIHRDDCAGALRHVASLERPEPLYLGADHEPATPATIAGWLAETFPGARENPGGPETGSARSGRPGRPGRASKRCSNARLLGSGYAFSYPTFREGFSALLAGS